MDTSLYVNESCRFTARGELTYWQAVDSMIRYGDTMLNRGKLKKLTQLNISHDSKADAEAKQIERRHADRFHWNKNESKRLPPPPPRKH